MKGGWEVDQEVIAGLGWIGFGGWVGGSWVLGWWVGRWVLGCCEGVEDGFVVGIIKLHCYLCRVLRGWLI